MEIVFAVFLGLWLSGFALWGYIRLKKDYKDVLSSDLSDKEENK